MLNSKTQDSNIIEDHIHFTKEMLDFFLEDAKERFLRYVKIESTSKHDAGKYPSTDTQLEFGKVLVKELKDIGLINVEQDDNGYVYAQLPPSEGYEDVTPINLIAHMDTSSSESGKDVKPVIHKNYDGGEIKFPANPELKLNPQIYPSLKKFIGDNIITSSGDTLLGADDKAGISEIMTACSSFKRFPELKHGKIIVCFTPDEEIGKGVEYINTDKLADIGYTMDGDEPGVINTECFDAYRVDITFEGTNTHPGFAKGRLINAIKTASIFISTLPESESPEHTEDREGFYHLLNLSGDVNSACATFILRDFDNEKNVSRLEYMNKQIEAFKLRYPGLIIKLKKEHSYKNMRIYLNERPEIIEKARNSIKDSGLTIMEKPVRGGTDGAVLCEKGIPTPNIFAGGMLFHSKREFIPLNALQKGVEVIIRLANYWKK
jgi:tripeptide aminopeptidase